jgi:glycosyltransferase involved in cell wall biosynthesis
LRVLAVSSYGVLGGAELSLVTFLDHRPPGVDATALLVEDGPLGERLGAAGIPVRVARGQRGRPSPAGAARFTRSLGALLRRERPDVVWAVGMKAAALALPACRLAGVPLVWNKVDFSLDRAIALPLGAGVHAVVGVSRAVTEALGPFRRKVVAVVEPPVRLSDDAVVAPAASPPAIGTLGRLEPVKGQERIVRAAALLSGEFPDLRVLLFGDESPAHPGHRAELRSLADALGLGERVELPGYADDAVAALSRLTVFVTATWRDERGYGWEGLSGAMLEAAWVGLPVVAARGGGTAEGLVDGVTGTLVEEADPALLAAIHRRLLRYRRIGHDLHVQSARLVPLLVEMHVCVRPHYLIGHVEAELLDVFSNRVLADGRKGFFHPDNLSFGDGIYLSRLVAAAQAVEGVQSVEVTRLERFGDGPNGEIERGVLPLGPLEVAQLDNDPSLPENGTFTLNMGGGR